MADSGLAASTSSQELTFDFLSFAGQLIFFSYSILLIIFLVQMAASWNSYLGLILYSLLFMLAATSCVIGTIGGNTNDVRFSKDLDFAFSVVAASTFLLFVSFSELSRYIYIDFGGYHADSSGYWQWLRLGLVNMLGGVLADFSQIYGLPRLSIKPTNEWTRTLLFSYRLLVELVVITSLIKFSRFAISHRMKSRRDPVIVFFKVLYSEASKVFITLVCLLPLLAFLDGIYEGYFSMSGFFRYSYHIFLVSLGFCLVSSGLRGLDPHASKWSILFSLVGLVIGPVLIYKMWIFW